MGFCPPPQQDCKFGQGQDMSVGKVGQVLQVPRISNKKNMYAQ